MAVSPTSVPSHSSEPVLIGRKHELDTLAWALALAPNVLLIPGASSVDHLRENLAAAAVQLDRKALDRLSAI